MPFVLLIPPPPLLNMLTLFHVAENGLIWRVVTCPGDQYIFCCLGLSVLSAWVIAVYTVVQYILFIYTHGNRCLHIWSIFFQNFLYSIFYFEMYPWSYHIWCFSFLCVGTFPIGCHFPFVRGCLTVSCSGGCMWSVLLVCMPETLLFCL